MLRLVSVEQGQEDIKALLSERGYEVVDMGECPRAVEAVIYSSQPLPNPKTGSGLHPESTVLVNAAGRTPEEVASELETRLC